ncbi:MAG: hypothetical protein ACKVIY_16755, partial [Acidimicrobiales bacterium]
VKPANAALSPKRAGPSTTTLRPQRDVMAARSDAAADAAVAMAAGAALGGPSGRPVSAIAPLPAHPAIDISSVVMPPATTIERSRARLLGLTGLANITDCGRLADTRPM